ncbi:hypothetical protein D7X55_29225 [Corallococcus sp. AB049A]|nr:hypothetical protein D7X55_29225 [Corallococcus sp. AB049A]
MLKWFVGALALLALACGGVSEPSTPVIRDGEGLLELPLVSTSAGRSYKLVGATFAITGPQNTTLTDTSADSVSVALMAGTYSIQMNGNWHVERTDAPGVTVPVTLVSPNPMTFILDEGETRPVRFLFKVPGDGTADVRVGVDSGGWISGTLQFNPRTPPPTYPGGPNIPDPFADVAGKTVPFVISFDSSTVTRSTAGGYKHVDIQTSPVTLQFGGATGAVFQQQFVSALQGQTLSFSMATPFPTSMFIGPVKLENQERGVRLEVFFSDLFPGADAEGYSLLQPTSFNEGAIDFYFAGAGTIGSQISNGTFAPR